MDDSEFIVNETALPVSREAGIFAAGILNLPEDKFKVSCALVLAITVAVVPELVMVLNVLLPTAFERLPDAVNWLDGILPDCGRLLIV